MSFVANGWKLLRPSASETPLSAVREATHYDPYFEVKKASDNTWFWRIVAHNGETLCHSETYGRKDVARIAARKMASRMNYRVSIREV